MQIRVARMGRLFSLGSEKLHTLMVENDWSQSDVVGMIDKKTGVKVAPSVINRLVHGHRRPSLPLAVAMEAALDIPSPAWCQPPSEGFRLERSETAEPDRESGRDVVKLEERETPTGTES
jgi:hypothetical protein